MNFKSMADKKLLQGARDLVSEERYILSSLLYHLQEIERRRLFSGLGYKSLYDFTVKHLKYSEDQACRRIAAMRLLKEFPEIEDKINSGDLSLSHMGLAQAFFRKEKKHTKFEVSRDRKLSLIHKIQNKPIREASKIAFDQSLLPQPIVFDQMKSVSKNQVEVKFLANSDVYSKVEKLKGLLAHKNPDISLGELFEKLCDLGLEKWDLSTTATSRVMKKKSAKNQSDSGADVFVNNVFLAKDKIARDEVFVNNEIVKSDSASSNQSNLDKTNSESSIKTNISKAALRRQIFAEFDNQCSNCGSSYALEIDHIIPQAKGGSSDKENLRVLCRTCNQHAAIKEFGINKMEQFLR